MGPVVADLIHDLETGDRSKEFLTAGEEIVYQSPWMEMAAPRFMTGLFKQVFDNKVLAMMPGGIIEYDGSIQPRKGVLITNITA